MFVGTQVKILHGPFRGRHGIVGCSRGDEVEVTLQEFGDTIWVHESSLCVVQHLGVPVPPSRADRIAGKCREMRELGAEMLDDALSSAEALVQKLRELADTPRDAVPDGQRDAAGKLAADLNSRVTTMRQIQARAGQ